MTTYVDNTLQLTFPSEREIVITRVFNAPRHLVFAALTQVEHVRQWYGPRYLTIKSCEIDLRVGGKWRYVMQAPDDSEFAFSGIYQEIVPPERIVSTELFEAMPGTDYLATVSLTEQAGKTLLTNHLRYQSQEHRDGHLNAGMEGGMRETFERLNNLVIQMDRTAAEPSNSATFELVVTRHFDAPAEMVFAAWLDPDAVGHWLFATPTGEMKQVTVDARVGGEFVIAEQRGEILAEHFGRYTELDRPRRLAFTFTGQRDDPHPSLVMVEIEPDSTGCQLTLTQRMDIRWAEYSDRTRAGWTGVLEGLYNEVTADRQIVLTRIFDAPRALVWQVWTDPRHVDQWWGPDGFRNETFAMDVRPGGLWRYLMHGPDDTDYPNRVVYHEVTPPERLVYTHGSDVNDDPEAFHVTVTFTAQGDKTLITMRSRFATVAQRQALMAFGAVEGGQQTLAHLADYLQRVGLSADEQAIRTLYQQLLACWNDRNAPGFAALFAEDGNVIGFDGSQMNSRGEIASTLSTIFSDHQTATYVSKVREVRMLDDNIGLLRAVAGMVPPGQADINPAVNAVQTLVATQKGSNWCIALFQNTPAQFHSRPELSQQLSDELRQLLPTA